MEQRLRLAPNASVYALGPDRIAVGGLDRDVYLNGPSQLSVGLLEGFKAPGATFPEAFRALDLGGLRPDANLKQELQGLVGHLQESGVLVDGREAGTQPRFASVTLLAPDSLGQTWPLELAGIHMDRLPWHGADRALELASRVEAWDGDGTRLVAAYGLSDSDLHAVNRIMLGVRQPWLFCTPAGDTTFLSPVLHVQGDLPCFACLRMQRIGYARNLVSNTFMETLLSGASGLRPVQSAPPELDPTRTSLELALLANKIRIAQWSRCMDPMTARFQCVHHREGRVTSLMAFRIPGCPACGRVAP